MSSENFLSRWSRRKGAVRAADAPDRPSLGAGRPAEGEAAAEAVAPDRSAGRRRGRR